MEFNPCRKMNEILQKAFVTQPTPETLAAPIGIKLDGTNYALWYQVVEMYIYGKDKLSNFNGELRSPDPTDPLFRKW